MTPKNEQGIVTQHLLQMRTKMIRLQELMLEIDEVLRDSDPQDSNPYTTLRDAAQLVLKESSKSDGRE